MAGERLDPNLQLASLVEGPVAEPMVRVVTEGTRDLLRLGDEGPFNGETPIRYKLVPLSTLGDSRAQCIGKRVLNEVIGKAKREDAERAIEHSAPRGFSVNGGEPKVQSAR